MAVTTYNVPDISCDHCKSTITGCIAPLPGVEAVDVDVETKTVTVSGGDPTVVQTALADAGYSTA